MGKRQIYIRSRALCAAVLILTLLAGLLLSSERVYAAGGTVYTCTITPCYQHPVTGVIEDSGGSASYATGQGMVEGAVYSAGMLEVTDAGEYYLTFRVSLVDYTTNHAFSVQEVGASGWSSTGMAVTATGKDNNGTTADICIQVPSESCVVRGSMYVTPMGRDVIFYLYPSNYSEGIPDGMNPYFITEESASETEEEADADASEETQTDASDTDISDTDISGLDLSGTGTDERSGLSDASRSDASAPVPESSIKSLPSVSAPEENFESAEALNSAQGLSLSTAPDSAAVLEEAGTSSGQGVTALGIGTAITVSGLILLCTAAVLVYYFRINWRRWGGDDDED
ncbi:MAG: hypothetical protein K2N46_00185 [Lachnospiraceae bacterium]|nr:hypothetical protein [Lachnospiraceae bacterium]